MNKNMLIETLKEIAEQRKRDSKMKLKVSDSLDAHRSLQNV